MKLKPTTEAQITPKKREEIINYMYDFNVRADVEIEELVDDIISILRQEEEDKKIF